MTSDLDFTDVPEIGIRVLSCEAEAVAALADQLKKDGDFQQQFINAATHLYALGLDGKQDSSTRPGRLIVTGMGKSGHIAQKIAATFASTGTPAQFVHPAEASHGDLGMITQKDTLLALSNSGETAELAVILEYARRHDITLIAMTSVATSSLAKAATILLSLPEKPEAGIVRLAPTTSTTMMLALGDALAIAVMEKRRFGAKEFQVFHPGGKLGQQLQRVESIMHTGDELPLITPDQPVKDSILRMTAGRFGCVGVIDEAGDLIGIVTDGDLRRQIKDPHFMTRATGEIMTAGPKTLPKEELAGQALALMNKNNITVLFIVEEKKPCGILHIHDLLRRGVA